MGLGSHGFGGGGSGGSVDLSELPDGTNVNGDLNVEDDLTTVDLVVTGNAQEPLHTSAVADGAAAVAFDFNTTNALSTSGAKLTRLRNNSVEKAYDKLDGGHVITGVASGATALLIPTGSVVDFGAARKIWDNTAGLTISAAIDVGGRISRYDAQPLDLCGSAGAAADSVVSRSNNVSLTTGRIHVFKNNTTEVSAMTKDGKSTIANFTDASGTPGDATINKPAGKVAFASGGATSITVTSDQITANSVVHCNIVGNADATLTSITWRVASGGGSVVITGNAVATADVKVNFVVFN